MLCEVFGPFVLLQMLKELPAASQQAAEQKKIVVDSVVEQPLLLVTAAWLPGGRYSIQPCPAA